MGSKEKTVTEKYNSIFAVRLRETMDNKVNGLDLSATQLAKAIGVSRQTICNYRNGESVPDAVNLCRIAKVYNISAEYLTGLTSSYSTDKDKRFISDELGFSDDMIDRILAFKENENYDVFLRIVDTLLQDDNYLWIENILHYNNDVALQLSNTLSIIHETQKALISLLSNIIN